MTHAELIRKLIDYKHINISQLAKDSGINRNTLGAILNRNQQKVRPEIYMPIANCLDIPCEIFEKNEISEYELSSFLRPLKNKLEFEQLVSFKCLEQDDILQELNSSNPISNDLLYKLFTQHLQYPKFYSYYSEFDLNNYQEYQSALLKLYWNNTFFDEEFHNHLMNLVENMEINETQRLLSQYKGLPEQDRRIIRRLITFLYEQHLSTKKLFQENLELLKTRNEKYSEGLETGRMQILIPLVKEGIYTLEEAASRSSMTKEELKLKMEKADQEEAQLRKIFGPSQKDTSN